MFVPTPNTSLRGRWYVGLSEISIEVGAIRYLFRYFGKGRKKVFIKENAIATGAK